MTLDSRLLTLGSRAVFLDRDGTIAEDVNYCSRVEDFRMLPCAPDAIRILNDRGFKVVLITNQSGIGRGYFNQQTLTQIHDRMTRELAENGARVDAIYYCPHHPDEGCGCRKPKPAMFLQASDEMGIDLKRSYMIGDMQSDIDGGKAAGCKTILVMTGPSSGRGIVNPPDHTAENLLAAARWIVGEVPGSKF